MTQQYYTTDFNSNNINGSITVFHDKIVVNFEYIESYWGTIFGIIPCIKQRTVPRNVVRTRDIFEKYSIGGRYARYGELDDVMIMVLDELCNEAIDEFVTRYPEPSNIGFDDIHDEVL